MNTLQAWATAIWKFLYWKQKTRKVLQEETRQECRKTYEYICELRRVSEHHRNITQELKDLLTHGN